MIISKMLLMNDFVKSLIVSVANVFILSLKTEKIVPASFSFLIRLLYNKHMTFHGLRHDLPF